VRPTVLGFVRRAAGHGFLHCDERVAAGSVRTLFSASTQIACPAVLSRKV
jgi:hypothetical protein